MAKNKGSAKPKTPEAVAQAGLKQHGYGPKAMLAWKDYGDYIVVVTVDGKKFEIWK